MLYNIEKKYNVVQLDKKSTRKIYGGGIFERIGCRFAEIIHNYFHDQPVKAVYIKDFAEQGDNYA